MKEYRFEDINGKIPPIKMFGSWNYPNGKPALCQIKGCLKEASWLIPYKDISTVFCFKHGEDLKARKQ